MLLPDLFHDDFRQRSYHDWYEVLVNLLNIFNSLRLLSRIGRQTLASSATKRAKGDPLPDFPAIFYNNEIGKEAPESPYFDSAQHRLRNPSPRWIVRGGKFLLNNEVLIPRGEEPERS